MKRTILLILGAGVAIGAGFLISDRLAGPETVSEDNSGLSKYFQEQMISLGVEDIGVPIEGFDSNLLIMAFPGLVPADFDGVETAEGRYELEGKEAVFVRNTEQPISSAERMVSEEGYATLLENVSSRLDMKVLDQAGVNDLISEINTSEKLGIKLGESDSGLGIKITAVELLEDSRCPANANCIQAGTVRVRTTVESADTKSEQIFILTQPVTIMGVQIKLVRVDPEIKVPGKVPDADYTFHFEIKKK